MIFQGKLRKIYNIPTINIKIPQIFDGRRIPSMKWRQLDERLNRIFAQKRANNIIIHDRDLQQLAMKIAEELQLDDFKAKNI